MWINNLWAQRVESSLRRRLRCFVARFFFLLLPSLTFDSTEMKWKLGEREEISIKYSSTLETLRSILTYAERYNSSYVFGFGILQAVLFQSDFVVVTFCTDKKRDRKVVNERTTRDTIKSIEKTRQRMVAAHAGHVKSFFFPNLSTFHGCNVSFTSWGRAVSLVKALSLYVHSTRNEFTVNSANISSNHPIFTEYPYLYNEHTRSVSK